MRYYSHQNFLYSSFSLSYVFSGLHQSLSVIIIFIRFKKFSLSRLYSSFNLQNNFPLRLEEKKHSNKSILPSKPGFLNSRISFIPS
ncbi:hypothetical protein EZS27_013493 [termite gut metagenome]|uniref:Uncharacterized protein n=1 Tax=termite gut metagenome TaxID=433724 RepID=A0A5J4RY57_9ZZZZ